MGTDCRASQSDHPTRSQGKGQQVPPLSPPTKGNKAGLRSCNYLLGFSKNNLPSTANLKGPELMQKHSLHLTNEVPAKQMSAWTGTLVPCHHAAPETEGSHPSTKHLQRQLRAQLHKTIPQALLQGTPITSTHGNWGNHSSAL